jgi:hypothetical protein
MLQLHFPLSVVAFMIVRLLSLLKIIVILVIGILAFTKTEPSALVYIYISSIVMLYIQAEREAHHRTILPLACVLICQWYRWFSNVAMAPP